MRIRIQLDPKLFQGGGPIKFVPTYVSEFAEINSEDTSHQGEQKVIQKGT